jgi:hypothetical protein
MKQPNKDFCDSRMMPISGCGQCKFRNPLMDFDSERYYTEKAVCEHEDYARTYRPIILIRKGELFPRFCPLERQ